MNRKAESTNVDTEDTKEELKTEVTALGSPYNGTLSSSLSLNIAQESGSNSSAGDKETLITYSNDQVKKTEKADGEDRESGIMKLENKREREMDQLRDKIDRLIIDNDNLNTKVSNLNCFIYNVHRNISDIDCPNFNLTEIKDTIDNLVTFGQEKNDFTKKMIATGIISEGIFLITETKQYSNDFYIEAEQDEYINKDEYKKSGSETKRYTYKLCLYTSITKVKTKEETKKKTKEEAKKKTKEETKKKTKEEITKETKEETMKETKEELKKKKEVGLFCDIKRGDNIYDDNGIIIGNDNDRLKWPLRRTVILCFIDQKTKKFVYSYDLKASFNKPNTNIGERIGARDRIAYEQLCTDGVIVKDNKDKDIKDKDKKDKDKDKKDKDIKDKDDKDKKDKATIAVRCVIINQDVLLKSLILNNKHLCTMCDH